ncbi:hypothetical protein N7478_007937 [Penicillium angulare]|uniref:uncharacterized protein n=1 Tax=Penicillium angulare TaxID=116970 RepID=UPI0025411189|nr:uncharacterized protein N7478_007937 [Penicillium angulare]KAJ5272812.1 hypothetical protein N7478_007937 [Penicillium angulare]
MSTPNNLQALLASIKPRPSPPNGSAQDYHQQQQRPSQSYQPGGMFPPHPQYPPYDGQNYPHPQMAAHGYHHPSVSSGIPSPAPNHPANTAPRHDSDILSPNVPTPRPEWNQPPPPQPNNPDRAVNLLNLLRFSQGSGTGAQSPLSSSVGGPEQSQSPPIQELTSSHGRNTSGPDLVASLFGGAQVPPAPAHVPAPAEVGVAPVRVEGASNDITQDMLLRLLNRSQHEGGPAEPPISVAAHQSIPQAASIDPNSLNNGDALTDTVKSLFGSVAKPETVVSPSKDSMFTYVNPFDQLAAISPQTKSPQPKFEEGEEEELTFVETTQALTTDVSVSVDDEPSPPVELAAPQQPKRSKSPVLEPNQQRAVTDVVGRLVDEIGLSLNGEKVPTVEAEAGFDTPAKDDTAEAVISSIAGHLRETATEAKAVAELTEFSQPAKASTEPQTAATVTQTRNENAEALADSWESAEDSAEKEEERVVSVQNFPLKPFISITVKSRTGKLVVFRDDGIMDIARLKKDFDQLDRSLTSATSDYIVYALAKSGGIRIIRQDDGSDRQVFRATRDRVFNVTLCTSVTVSGQPDVQAILGIGVSGAVYWALVSREGKDLFEHDALESESLIFPPFPASDENTSGGQLKTRAKRSTRHPDLFAIGRGKNIYVVSPTVAMNANYGVSGSQRTVNTEKFFKERALKISTGKAGKDFAFSDDDTVIASLDKTGRLRFWDIRDVLDRSNFGEGITPNEVRVPLNTFVTGSPAEKSWPTSVLFLDKLRPYSRSNALRYVLVGLKQNHTLQLWDIGLGKAVEELKFPHENESDAICSVAYHPSSGIIVVGHPTRNSIYFVHLSAPRYNLPGMSQAAFIKAATEKDSSLPKPDSTACLSGIREISLGSKGQLRSLELLSLTRAGTEKRNSQESDLFELYVMHSRGVTCLNIKKEDLGWTTDNKVITPIDALEDGSIEITDLQSFPSYTADDPSVNGDTASTPSRTAKEVAKKNDIADPSSGVVPSRNPSPTKTSSKKKPSEEPLDIVPTPSSAEKTEKKKKKKTPEAPVKAKEPTATAGVQSLPLTSQPKDSGNLASTLATMETDESFTGHGVTNDAIVKHFEDLRAAVSDGFNASLGREIETLFARFDEERRQWDTASNKKQETVLRLVSDKLSQDVEKNLDRVINKSISSQVLPAIKDATNEAVSRVVSEQLHLALPRSVSESLQNTGFIDSCAELVTQKISTRVENGIIKAVHNSLMPLIEKMAKDSKKAHEDAQSQIRRADESRNQERKATNAKLEQMEDMIRTLTSTVNKLAVTERPATDVNSHPSGPPAGFSRAGPAQNRPVHAQGQPTQIGIQPVAQPAPVQPQARAPARAPVPAPVHAPALAPAPTQSPLNTLQPPPSPALGAEIAEIRHVFEQGAGPDEAIIKWLQSEHQAEVFDHFFCRLDPSFLARLQPIIMLSVGVAVTTSLENNLHQRFHWLSVVLNGFDPRDPELAGVSARIMSVLTERLNTLYMRLVAENPHDPLLRRLPPLSRRVRELHSASL